MAKSKKRNSKKRAGCKVVVFRAGKRGETTVRRCAGNVGGLRRAALKRVNEGNICFNKKQGVKVTPAMKKRFGANASKVARNLTAFKAC